MNKDPKRRFKDLVFFIISAFIIILLVVASHNYANQHPRVEVDRCHTVSDTALCHGIGVHFLKH